MSKFFVHEHAICESLFIGEGTRIWAFSHILPGAQIGRNCNLCEGVFVENRVVIGDGCTIKNGVSLWDLVTLEENVMVGPNAVFTNDFRPRAFIRNGTASFRPTLVKRGATIGANATLVCGVTVGEFAMIAAGSVVTRDVPSLTLVAGNPARVIGPICHCGARIGSPNDLPTKECRDPDSHERTFDPESRTNI